MACFGFNRGSALKGLSNLSFSCLQVTQQWFTVGIVKKKRPWLDRLFEEEVLAMLCVTNYRERLIQHFISVSVCQLAVHTGHLASYSCVCLAGNR